MTTKTKNTILLFMIILMACDHQSSEEKLLQGTWTVSKAYIYRTEAESKYTGDREKTMDSMISIENKGMIYRLEAEGKLEILQNGEKLTGKWEMKKDKNGNSVSMIQFKGQDWEEAWVPSIGESFFYMKGIEDVILVKKLPATEDGDQVVCELSREK